VVPERLPVVVRRLARLDIENAASWYENRVSGLGVRFVDEVDRCFESISAGPDQYPIVHRDIHRALLKQFPYAVFFVRRGETVTVIACIHTRRHPKRAYSGQSFH
jgi:plasmid stabilization system protein ParE